MTSSDVRSIETESATVTPATEYETEKQVGWPLGGQSRVITAGTTFATTEFVDLIDTGRFEVAPL
ncbi:MAG: hypothetical protein ABEH58_03100 [Haloplanus sp.]